MKLSTTLLKTLTIASVNAVQLCTNDRKVAGVKQEIATIRSHSLADAEKIPYAELAYRVFTIIPNETNPTSVFVPAGVNAVTTRIILVGLGTALDADVPRGSDSYTVNPNGTVTVDYIQTDRPALQTVDVREIHTFDPKTCEILGVNGYVRGSVEDFTGDFNVYSVIGKLGLRR